MRRLPQIVTGKIRWALPMADRSAAALVEAVLADEPAQSTSRLAGPLAGDPPLVLWTLLAAARGNRHVPQSVEDVARWLAEHAVAVLSWQPKRDGPFDASGDSQVENCADLVAERLELADLAALVAAPDGQSAARQAHLAGLVHRPQDWLALAPQRASNRGAAALPEGLVELGRGAAEHVALAAKWLDKPDAPVDFDPEACRRRAGEGRRAWLATLAGSVDRLPALVARLSRLESLEHRFQETLEAEKLAAMAEFAAGAGHEINNPLAIIGGRAQLLLQEETDPERRHELAVMNAQVRRAHEMIADMRLFARPPKPEPETFDLVKLVDELVAELAPSLAHRAVSIEHPGHDGPLEIEADPAQLQVALRAMCKNALEAIGHGGRIEITLRAAGDDVEIRVSDDGPGIQPEQRRHLFDPFYSARQAGRGLGLGLSKCWRIVVTNHAGRIDVAGEPDKGATFTIVLPRRFRGKSAG